MVRANLLLIVCYDQEEYCVQLKIKKKTILRRWEIEPYHVSLNDDDKMHKLTIITY